MEVITQAEAEGIEQAWTEILLKEEWNLCATFTFDGEVTPRHILAAFGRFAVNLRRHTHGKKSRHRVPMFPVIEGKLPHDEMFLQRPHLHVLLKSQGSAEQTRALLRELWMASGIACGDPLIASDREHKDDWCIEILTAEDKERCIRYVLKQAKFNQLRIMTNYTNFIGFGI